jgi:hypothetical protein
MRRKAAWCATAVAFILPQQPCRAGLPASASRQEHHDGPDPAQLCRAAFVATERATRIPDAFLSAMGRVESGRVSGGTLNPWPWTVNAAGSGHFYATKAEAILAVRQFLASGIRSLDVGCLQVNLFYHPEAFASLEDAFDPAINTAFAAKLLLGLFDTTGSWPRAAAAYHSQTPAIGLAYQQKVLDAWAVPDRPEHLDPRAAAGRHAATPALIVPRAAAPDLAASASAAAGPPETAFTRRLMRPEPSAAAGRSLAAYRAAPVQMASRQPFAAQPLIPGGRLIR